MILRIDIKIDYRNLLIQYRNQNYQLTRLTPEILKVDL